MRNTADFQIPTPATNADLKLEKAILVIKKYEYYEHY
jgi:hypothetical protein